MAWQTLLGKTERQATFVGHNLWLCLAIALSFGLRPLHVQYWYNVYLWGLSSHWSCDPRYEPVWDAYSQKGKQIRHAQWAGIFRFENQGSWAQFQTESGCFYQVRLRLPQAIHWYFFRVFVCTIFGRLFRYHPNHVTACIKGYFEVKKCIKNSIKSTKFISIFCAL